MSRKCCNRTSDQKSGHIVLTCDRVKQARLNLMGFILISESVVSDGHTHTYTSYNY